MGKVAGRSKRAVTKNTAPKKEPRMPRGVKPMLATLVKKVPGPPEDFIYEIKWDGYRQIAFVENRNATLLSRKGLVYTAKYPLVVEALNKLKHNCILDGEIIVFDKNGKPDFEAVQRYNGARTPISYCVFDLLWLDGVNLKDEPLVRRKELLSALIGKRKDKVLVVSEVFTDGHQLYNEMMQLGMEGIVAKRKDSAYIEDNRSMMWLKIPIKRVDEFVIGGYAESDKRHFRSLLFGAYEDDGKLKWVGRSGGGFKEKEMPGILKKLRALEIKSSPFYNKVLDTKGAILHWIKPEHVGIFEYSEMTESGRIRKPATWKGFRYDKDPKQVIVPELKELPEDLSDDNNTTSTKASSPKSKKKPAAKHPKYLNKDSKWRYVDEEAAKHPAQLLNFDDCSIEVFNVNGKLWKDRDIRKGDLMLYYSKISSYILPHLYHRPQCLNIHLPLATSKPTRFIKDMEYRQPDCASVFTDVRRTKEEGKRDNIDYLVCNNKETLLYMINTGCIDINPWSSRMERPAEPDFLWLDLDPTIPKGLSGSKRQMAEDKGFQKAVETAMATKEVLSRYKLKSFIKTSGKTGLHTYVPCVGLNNDQVTDMAMGLAREIHKLLPMITTLARYENERGDEVYIDPHQNNYSKTLAAPYSVRAYDEPLVSTPLDWREVKPGLDRRIFTMDAVQKRLQKKGDIFQQVLDQGIALSNRQKLLKL